MGASAVDPDYCRVDFLQDFHLKTLEAEIYYCGTCTEEYSVCASCYPKHKHPHRMFKDRVYYEVCDLSSSLADLFRWTQHQLEMLLQHLKPF